MEEKANLLPRDLALYTKLQGDIDDPRWPARAIAGG
jgi:hypothetical protein